MKNFTRALLATSVIMMSTSAVAHHSFSATFKDDAKITVEGVVTKFSYKNPHVLVYFDVSNDDGTQTEWIIEGSAATLLRRGGWASDTLTAGMHIRATGDSTHDGSPMVTMDSIDVIDPASKSVIATLQRSLNGQDDANAGGDYAADATASATQAGSAEGMGRPDGMGGPNGMGGERREAAPIVKVETPLTLPNGHPNISGAWATGAGEDTGRPRRPDPDYNAVGLAKQATFDVKHDPQVFCDAPGVVRQSGTTPHPFIITQLEGSIVIEFEEYGGRREIPFSDKIPAPGVKTLLGDSVARIEGDSIIVTTVNLLESLASPEGTYLSDETTTVETFKRNDDDISGSVLSYTMETSDPKFLNKPMVQWKMKGLVSGYEMIGNDCQSPTRERTVVSPYMSFFLTDVGLGDGANLGGLAGADAHCEALAADVGQGGKGWRAYLSTTGAGGVNAKDRIGNGPWYNARGALIAGNLNDLIGADGITKASVVSQSSGYINARGDTPNQHDILTGTQNDGTALDNGEDTTCSNWTSNSDGTGSALVGHYDRTGGGADPSSWTNAHGSRGCSQANLEGTGGAGFFYCVASNPTASGIRSTSSAAKMDASLQNGASSAGQGAQASALNETGGGSKNWLLILGALILAGLGFVAARRKA